jgi:hypothetical protein
MSALPRLHVSDQAVSLELIKITFSTLRPPDILRAAMMLLENNINYATAAKMLPPSLKKIFSDWATWILKERVTMDWVKAKEEDRVTKLRLREEALAKKYKLQKEKEELKRLADIEGESSLRDSQKSKLAALNDATDNQITDDITLHRACKPTGPIRGDISIPSQQRAKVAAQPPRTTRKFRKKGTPKTDHQASFSGYLNIIKKEIDIDEYGREEISFMLNDGRWVAEDELGNFFEDVPTVVDAFECEDVDKLENSGTVISLLSLQLPLTILGAFHQTMPYVCAC